jgi:hypothetical protein
MSPPELGAALALAADEGPRSSSPTCSAHFGTRSQPTSPAVRIVVAYGGSDAPSGASWSLAQLEEQQKEQSPTVAKSQVRAQKTDPVIAARDRLQGADEAWRRAYGELDQVERRVINAGREVRRPMITVGEYCCMSMAEVICRARGLPKAEATGAINTMRS